MLPLWQQHLESWTTIVANVFAVVGAIGVVIAVRIALRFELNLRIRASRVQTRAARRSGAHRIAVSLPFQTLQFVRELSPRRWEVWWSEDGNSKKATAEIEAWFFHFCKVWLGTNFVSRPATCDLRYIEVKGADDVPQVTAAKVHRLNYFDRSALSRLLFWLIYGTNVSDGAL